MRRENGKERKGKEGGVDRIFIQDAVRVF